MSGAVLLSVVCGLVCGLGCAAGSARASILEANASIGLDARRLWQPEEEPGQDGDLSTAADEAGGSFWRHTGGFLEQDSTFLTVGAGVAFTDTATDTTVYGTWSKFIADDVELGFELRGFYFGQDGDDALGVSPQLLIRWHLWHSEEPEPALDPGWTIFAETGIGVYLSSDEVPEGGTVFNAAPRFGAGFTRRLTDSGVRLVAGFYWHHISNARIAGQDDNPSRDGVLVHAGVVFPF